MNVKRVVATTVIQMHNVQTLMEDLHVLVILDLLEMVNHALVSKCYILYFVCIYLLDDTRYKQLPMELHVFYYV
jgi:hypothetical protein